MIIVTGAGGFIGSNMVADLVVEGRGPVAVSDYWGTGNKCEKLMWCYVSGFVRLGELLDFVRAGGDRIRAIVHMGAISATTMRDIDKLSSHNIHATVDL
jgi:ADP-L-glycero-D-manno-heptose 6-epimerase